MTYLIEIEVDHDSRKKII